MKTFIAGFVLKAQKNGDGESQYPTARQCQLNAIDFRSTVSVDPLRERLKSMANIFIS